MNRNQKRQVDREKEKWDNTPAKMQDVDRAVSVAYKVLLRLISELNKTCNALTDEVNTMRAEKGLPPMELDAGTTQTTEGQIEK